MIPTLTESCGGHGQPSPDMFNTMKIELASTCLCVLIIMNSVLVSQQTLSRGLGSADEAKLLYYLFERDGYNPLIRPVRELNDTVDIRFSLALSQLISIDEKNQIMKTNVWLQMYWSDYQLVWAPEQFGGIEAIRIRPEKVWTPDIVLFNNADGNYEVTYRSNIVLNYNGEVYWIPPAIYKSSCTVDVEYFPFDQQECEMKFGSWTFRGKQLRFSWYHTQVDVTDYVKSGTWDIIALPGRFKFETDHGEEINQLVFTFIIRRKTLFYTVNLITPCVLISFVTVCVFALPADAGEKMTLCISILLALVVFLLLISKILPPSLKIPLISKYLLFTFIMNILAILITVIIINRNYRTPRTHRMPPWVRVVFLNYLPRILFMERPDHDTRCREKKVPYKSASESSVSNKATTRRTDFLELTEVHHPNCRLGTKSLQMDCSQMDEDGMDGKKMSLEFGKGCEAVQFITRHIKAEDEYDTVQEDWKYVAMVLDRLCLYIFVAVTLGGSLGIFVSAPHIFEFVDQDKIIDAMKNGA